MTDAARRLGDAPHHHGEATAVPTAELDAVALVVVDVQVGFDDPAWGAPALAQDPRFEANLGRLLATWRERGRPVVFVRHDSVLPDSPLAPGGPGNALRPVLGGASDLLVVKSVNSAFHGAPDLDRWLRAHAPGGMVVCGLTTSHCCETTARVGGNLGHRVWFALDATHAFDRVGPDGTVVTAAQLRRATAANLHGEFATVVPTAALL